MQVPTMWTRTSAALRYDYSSTAVQQCEYSVRRSINMAMGGIGSYNGDITASVEHRDLSLLREP
jgi:hypothetical protein